MISGHKAAFLTRNFITVEMQRRGEKQSIYPQMPQSTQNDAGVWILNPKFCILASIDISLSDHTSPSGRGWGEGGFIPHSEIRISQLSTYDPIFSIISIKVIAKSRKLY